MNYKIVQNIPSIVDHASNESGPSTLVSGSQAASIVTIKELMEPEVILPVLIKVQAVVTTVDATSSVVGTGE